MQPCPKTASEVTLYGIAWEFIWGEEPPKAVADARKDMLRKAGAGEDLTMQEELWLKLIVVDTDYF
jgi:hypothetical protein